MDAGHDEDKENALIVAADKEQAWYHKRHLLRKREEDADEDQEIVYIKRGRSRRAEPQSHEDTEMEMGKARE